MGQTERIALWTVLALVSIGLLTLAVFVAGELAEVNRQLLALAGGGAGDNPLPTLATEGSMGLNWGLPAPARQAGGQAEAQVGVAGVTVLSDSVTLTVTVRAYGAGDMLFEPPVLQSAEGQVYPVSGASLAEARMAFLDLVTRGEATARLEFSGRLAPTESLWLIFNPNQEPANVTAPSMRVAVPLREG